MHVLSEQEQERRKDREELYALGINPYPAVSFFVNATAEDIHKNYENNKTDYKDISIAGRLMSRRIMGSASFAELQDATGRLQLYIRRDDIQSEAGSEFYNTVFKKLLGIGDFIGVRGYIFTTQTGEISLHVTSLKVLSKAVKPLPIVKRDEDGTVYDGFTDPEQRYRQRYVDLTVNPEVKKTFITRAKIISTMRRHFDEQGWLEVETPILQAVHGGAAARPFTTHHNTLDMPLFLRIANELYLKRLIVGGFDGVYEFGKMFRNEGMDRTHNPEFTSMEIYVAYKDYNWMMDFTERLLEHCAMSVNGTTKATFSGHNIDFKAPFKRVTMRDAILEFTGFDIHGKSEEALFEAAKGMGLEVDATMGKGKLIDEIFGAKCEGNYIQPTFITDYPKEMSPLCKVHRDNPELTERFELMVCGKEIANAYSELNDPIDQRERFEEQLRLSERGDDEAMFIDQDFLRALEYGMPPTSGLGIGMDRLIMFLTDNPSIQEVLFFPQMRPEVKSHKLEMTDNEKLIYSIVEKDGDMELNDLKNAVGLSNKQWDVSIKSLTKQGALKVTKSDDVLTVSLG